jgi:hypothetical protein
MCLLQMANEIKSKYPFHEPFFFPVLDMSEIHEIHKNVYGILSQLMFMMVDSSLAPVVPLFHAVLVESRAGSRCNAQDAVDDDAGQKRKKTKKLEKIDE